MKSKPPIIYDKKQIGKWGEDIVTRYYTNKGHKIIGRNYLKKWGEIDVISKMNEKVHFIEVKTVSYETKVDLSRAISHGTWRPEENVTNLKIQKLNRAINSWCTEFNWSGDWQIDVVAVRIVPRETYATVKVLDNVVIS